MLRGPRVHLRTVRSSDLEQLLDLGSDIANRGLYFPLDLQTETSIKERFDRDAMWSKESGSLLVFESGENRLIGSVVFFKTTHYYQGFEVGYRIYDPKDHGKGYATEAMSLFCKYLFDAKPILRLTIQLEPNNVGSRRVAEKCGFKLEGIARSVFESYGKPTDIEVWSLTHSDVYPQTS